MWTRVSLLILSMFLLGSVLTQPTLGKEYPTKSVEIVVPYPAGGGIDIMSRFIVEIASKYLGQPINVVNKAGAGGSIAAADVISSKPDGYKLVILTNIFFATTVKTQKIPFVPNNLIPIANIWEVKSGILVRGDSPWKTLADLLDYAKNNPGKLRWAHAGRGITTHLNALLIFGKAGVETIEVPYKGISEMLPALLGGHVDAISTNHGSIIDHVRVGNLRYLVLHSDRRYSDLSNVPCATELGFTEVGKLAAFFGFYAHKDTSKKIKETLIDVFKKTYEDPKLKKGIEKLGEEPRFGGPEFVMEAVNQAEEVGVPMLKELGLYVGR